MTKIADVAIDQFDAKILNLVQTNNQLSHSDIGDQIGLSTSAVRRRLVRLRTEGVIAQDVSILQNDFGVTLIVSVSFLTDSVEGYEAFDQMMAEDANVMQSYHVSGTTDYILVVKGPSLPWYDEWSKRVLMSNKDLRRHDTSVVYSCKKFETAIEI